MSTPATRTLTVALGERAYPIRIGSGLLDERQEWQDALGARRGIVISNETVAGHWLPALRRGLGAQGDTVETILLPDGEAHKNWTTLQDLLTRLLELKAERSTVLIALGGGVVGDLAGFAAAIYQRGMPFVQVPTTLLAQVDSSVGGKTGINHPLGKNMVGAFHQPQAVIIDTQCLGTLPPREFAAGLAEVIKYGAIRDADFFVWLEANMDRLLAREADALGYAIHESCRIKAEIVAVDEREAGERALLNFGHTFGHAIEAGTGYGSWLHGEAVATGMLMAATLSGALGELAPDDVARLRRLLERAGLPVAAPALGAARYLELMGRDKKVESGGLRFILLDRIGKARVRADVPLAALHSVLA